MFNYFLSKLHPTTVQKIEVHVPIPNELSQVYEKVGMGKFRGGLLFITDPAISESLISDWSWRLPKTAKVWARTGFGDLFIYSHNNQKHLEIFFLDTMQNNLNHIGASFEIVLNDVITESEFFREKLFLYFFSELIQHGLDLDDTTCFSYKIPIVLGGKIESDNVEVCDLSIHLSIQGQIFKGIEDKQLEPGDKLRINFE